MTDIVSLLDYSDLVCCGEAMTPSTRWQASVGGSGTQQIKGHSCVTCKHFMSEVAFLQNSHGTRAQRRARIANKEVGHAA